jgi:hypothetical protein
MLNAAPFPAAELTSSLPFGFDFKVSKITEAIC